MIEIIDEEARLNETEIAFYTGKLEKVLAALSQNGDVSIKLGGKEEAHALNKKFLDRDYPPDVLSFLFDEELAGGYYLGDVFICYPVAGEQAENNHVSLEEELFTLMVHGILHLAGFDHENDDGVMEARQQELVKQFFPG